jgi:allantoicase
MSADHSTADFTSLADLASARVGGRAIAVSDDFFAPKSNLVTPAPPVFIADKFTSRGKWMDGWESRRRRTPGHDWCVVALGMRGRIRGVNIDTSFFTGNFPSHASIDALDAAKPLSAKQLEADPSPVPRPGAWIRILDKVELRGNAANVFALAPAALRGPATHVRLNIYPDGGVARLRVYGEAEIDWAAVARAGKLVDLASIRMGGLVLAVNDMHFGAKDNMIMPGRAKTMADGWETRRRRGPGHDWALVKLGAPGRVSRIEIDTNHFKGNYPDRASIDACLRPGARVEELQAADWSPLLPESKLRAHARHFFSRELTGAGRVVSHLRLNIFPDGGISRLRVHGRVAKG